MNRLPLPRWRHLLMLMAVVTLAVPAAANENAADDRLLADQWWDEPAHGLRLRPPAHAERMDHTTDGALASFLAPGGLRLAVFIKEAEDGYNLAKLREAAFDHFAFAYPSAVYINPKITPPPRMRWAATMIAAKDQEGRDLRWGQVFLVIDDGHFAIIEMQTSRDGFDHAMQTLNAVLRSVSLMKPLELRQMRADQMLIGQQWLAEKRKQVIDEPGQAERWYRVVEDGEDVGYRRVQVITDPQALRAEKLDPGIAVKEQTRIGAGGRVFDIALSAYESGDRTFEMWEARTTLRKQQNAGTVRTATWADTGFRTDRDIQVTRDAPADMGAVQDPRANPGVPESSRWRRPPVAYLAQIELHLLTPHWHTLPEDACFYAYDVNSGDLAQRLVSVSDGEHGGKLVTIRPTPASGRQRLTYDENGKLVRHEMADGRTFIPTTPEQIAALWGVGR